MGYFFKRAFALVVLVLSAAIPAHAQQLPPGAEFAGGAAVAAGIVLLGDKDSATSTTGTRSPVGGILAPGAASGPSGPFGHPGTAGNPGGDTGNGPLPPGGAAGYDQLFIFSALPIDCGVVCVVVGTATSTISSTSTTATSP
jgi:hypothetical protein